MDSHFTTIFPHIIHEFYVEEFEDNENKLIDFAYEEKLKSTSIIRSNRGGWHSHEEYNETDNILSRIVNKSLVDHFSDTNIFVPGITPSIMNLWMIINGKGHYNQKHIHPGSWLSGAFWLKTPENCGDIQFENPNIFSHWVPMKLFNDDSLRESNFYHEYHWSPKAGKILLFPSSLSHQVLKSESDEDRIVCSFNLTFENEEILG